ncbi:MAG: energy-coupled thiamine transporter ThiT [Clostridia bacterium]|nr:energy-coupled thiamine transporter ThiT [Clostridia bacterium]
MNKNIKKIAVSAMLIALSSVLSEIWIVRMPLGGKLTLLSMLPVMLLVFMFGRTWGFFSAFVYSLVQLALGFANLMTWGMNATMWVGAIVFDYILAYTVLGIAGLFQNKGYTGICIGTTLALAGRFLCHTISGTIFFANWSEWSNPFIYSVCYNGAYMLPELILTLIAVVILYKTGAVKRILSEVNK